MALPKAKVNVYERRIARLQKMILTSQESKVALLNEHARVRKHYQDVVAQHIANERRGDALLLEDRFKIQELDNQVAVQWKNLAEAKDDAATAKLNQAVLSKEVNQLRAERQQLRLEIANRDVSVQSLLECVKRLEHSFAHRLWMAIATQIARSRVGIALQLASIKRRLVARFMIRRLSAARVSALNEAGHIPEKLVKTAIKYWEHDQQRMQMDEQIREVHYGTHNGVDWKHEVIERRPSLWQRLMILVGRA